MCLLARALQITVYSTTQIDDVRIKTRRFSRNNKKNRLCAMITGVPRVRGMSDVA